MLPKKSPQNVNSSVFKLTMLYVENKSPYPVRLSTLFYGYYTSLQDATRIIKRINKPYVARSDFYFKVFEVEEFILNSGQDEPFRHRVYDKLGRFYSEYKWWGKFNRRKNTPFHLKRKKLVDFIQWHNEERYLNIGIVAHLPPTLTEYRQLLKKGCELTESDASYRILSYFNYVSKETDAINKRTFSISPRLNGQYRPFIFESENVPEDQKNKLLEAYEKHASSQ